MSKTNPAAKADRVQVESGARRSRVTEQTNVSEVANPVPTDEDVSEAETKPAATGKKVVSEAELARRTAALEALYLPKDGIHDIKTLLNALRAPCETHLELVKRIVAFITVGFSARPARPQEDADNGRTVDQILDTRWASCGDRDFLIFQLFRDLHIKARRVGFANVPFQGAHTATEIFVDGEWRFFDATTGFYFAVPGTDTPISLRQARQLYPLIQTYRTRVQPMTKPVDTVLDVAWQQATLAPAYDAAGNIYCLPKETYFSCPVMGGEVLAYDDYDLAIDVDEKPVWTFGQPDVSGSISEPLRTHGAIKLVPMLERLGKYHDGNTRHNFHVLSRGHKRLQLTVVLREGQSTEHLEVAAMHMITPEYLEPPFSEAKLVSKYYGGSGNVAVFDIHLLPPLTKVTLSLPWNHEAEVRFIGFQTFPGGRVLGEQNDVAVSSDSEGLL